MSTWQIATASVRGASHTRAGLPNQDAICQLPIAGEGWPLLAVADGHGSAKSFRSAVGAMLAVATAMVVTPKLLSDAATASAEAMQACLPQRLVEVWRTGVERHLMEQPFTDAEWTRLNDIAGAQGCSEVKANPWLAYGATLLLATVRAEQVVYAQLGDGDILLVADDGTVSRPRWAADRRLFANETTSLCMAEAWREMRVDVQPIGGALSYGSAGIPALMMLATDGYANSFARDADFRRVGSDLWQMIRSDGLETVASALPEWLEESSRLGSGDDITVGLMARMNGRPKSSLPMDRMGVLANAPTDAVGTGVLANAQTEQVAA